MRAGRYRGTVNAAGARPTGVRISMPATRLGSDANCLGKRMKLVATLLIAVFAYLLFWPVPIQPQGWTPPEPIQFPENHELASVERIAREVGIGPEAVNVDSQGRLVTGFIDGRVARFAADGSRYELLADTRGRPLGIAFSSTGEIIVADAIRGLLKIDLGGQVIELATSAGGQRLGFVDDLDVSADDIVYFSDASTRFGLHQVREDFFEHRPNGRLVSHDLNTGQTRVLVPNLYFANGVALGPDETYVLVNETAKYRIRRHWLKGAQAGTTEIFVDNLPGLPDNVTFNGSDRFWVAIYAPRDAGLDALLPRPFLRKVVFRLPQFLQPDPAHHAYVLGLGLDGKVTHNLQDPGAGSFAPITSVREAAGWLYFGSLSETSLARMPVPAAQLN